MKLRLLDFGYPFLTIAFTVFGQLMVKWRVLQHGGMDALAGDKVRYIGALLMDPGILAGLTAGFLAAICWMAALTKFDLSYIYPITSLSFVLVLIISALVFREPITTPKVTGVALILIGTMVACQK